MKRKKLIFIFLIILLIVVTIIGFARTTNAEESKLVETTEQTAEVSNQTILTTLTAPGEVKSAKTEKISLNTSYYYLTMCAEENDYVKAGENLLKYTNGTYITAPYDCVILGYSVPTAKDICTDSNYINISSVEELYMDINISEEQIEKISVGQEVDIVANYNETKTYKGTISKINAIGTYSSGGTTFAAIASIENDDTLKIGMSATCTVTIEKNENVTSLPIEAISVENNEKFVNLINDNGTTEKVKVETGKSNANYVEILSGVSLGNKVKYETTIVTVNSSSISNSTENALTSLFNTGNKASEKNYTRGGYTK